PPSFPIFAAVSGVTFPDAPRLCSASSFSISSRSTTRAAGLAASSEISIPAMPFCSASKFSLSCPYEPLLSNGSTAMPGRVSWPRPWAPRSRPIEPSSANETNARRRARIESVPRSESQCHAFLRRHDLGGQTLRSCLAAGGRGGCEPVAESGAGVAQAHRLHSKRPHGELTRLHLLHGELRRQRVQRDRKHGRVHLLAQDRLERRRPLARAPDAHGVAGGE